MNDIHSLLSADTGNEISSFPKANGTQRHPLKNSVRTTALDVDQFDDLICLSHLRWNFVYQRPQHLLSRAAAARRVWYVEEPIWDAPGAGSAPSIELRLVGDRLTVVVPHVPHGATHEEAIAAQRTLLNQLIAQQGIERYALWYYTPMALLFSDHLTPQLTIYDCMDELSAFLGAPPRLLEQEHRLLQRADVVFTGGYSLYEAKQKRHPRVFAFPSCIDFDHFFRARTGLPDPADQAGIAGPRIGYSGVIDERLNLPLIAQLAERRPEWQFIFLGPVVKISPDSLPKGPNIHYLGMKAYEELPAYFSHWQAALMPFAITAATRYISPTKTPEYLAAGLPVASTPIRDVLRTYGKYEPVVIADSADALQEGIARQLSHPPTSNRFTLDQFLREQSWDNTWQRMAQILTGQLTSTRPV